MEEIKIMKVQLATHIKLVCLNWIGMGIIFGLVMFIFSLFGFDIKTNLGPFVFSGVAGGLSAIIVGPIVFCIFGVIIGLSSYVPFNIMLKIIKGVFIKVKGNNKLD